MHATTGDRISVSAPTVSQPPRTGTIMEVSPGGRMRVAWDDGTESTYMPAAGAAVIMTGDGGHHTGPDRFGCTIDIAVVEQDGDSMATATMRTPRGSWTGEGASHRHPEDPSVPMIGEELAVGRALRSLADQLEQAAMDAIADHESRPIHLLQPS